MNIQEISEKWQKKWKENYTFVPQINDKEKFFITVPYPYISGSLHIGHARVVTEADVLSRFQRLKGKNVLFPIAFHISGTPVLGISTAIKLGDEKKIKLYTNYVRTYVKDEEEVKRIVKSFEEPQNIVDFFIPKMIDEFSSLGLAVDWSRAFTSGDAVHRKLVEWQFKRYEQKGYLVRGKYPVLFSTLMDNAVGEDDIADGDTSPVEKQEFTLVKFKQDDHYLVAATLRPETLYGQTNLWINPTIEYVKAQVDNETWIISKECAEKLGFQDRKLTIKAGVIGKELIGKTCLAPFINKEILILPSEHCDPDKGTGIVTSVPSDAPFDYIALEQLKKNPEKYNLTSEQVNIRPISIINSKGYGAIPAQEICKKLNITSLEQKELLDQATQEIYKAGFHTGILKDNCGLFANKPVAEAKESMKKELINQKNGEILWETNRPAQDRAGGKVIVAILDNQWFLDFNAKDWKYQAQKALDKIEIQPNKFRKRFEDVFDWLDKRPCARRRGLGTKLPQDPEWVIESLSDSTLYMTCYTIAAKLKEYNIEEQQLTPEFFDYIFLGEINKGSVSDSTGIPEEQLEELRKQFMYWYPLDQRHTFTAHLANHLSFSLFAHAALLPENLWPKKFSFHGMVISEGQKMSKSKGNVVSLLKVKNEYGPDTFRAAMCSTTSVESTFNWSEKEMSSIKSHLENLFDLILSMKEQKEVTNPSTPLQAFISKTERGIRKITESLEKMDLRSYANFVLYELYNNYKKAKNQLTEDQLKMLHSYLFEKWIILLSPLTPHMAEELWPKEGFVSLAEWLQIDSTRINEKAEFSSDIKENVIKDIRTVTELVKIPNPKKITLIIADAWKYSFLTQFKTLLEQTRNPGDILKQLMQEEEFKQHGKEIAKIVPMFLKDQSKIPDQHLTREEEQNILNETKEAIQKIFNAEVVVELSENSQEKKTSFPTKPGIIVS